MSIKVSVLDLAKAVEARQRLDSQQQENELVNKVRVQTFRMPTTHSWEQEFEHLEDDANIYKLIGPVLVKQEKAEASTNVKNRLELINKEM